MLSINQVYLIVLIVILCYAIRICRKKKILKEKANRKVNICFYKTFLVKLKNIHIKSYLHYIGLRNGRYASLIKINNKVYIKTNLGIKTKTPVGLDKVIYKNFLYLEISTKNYTNMVSR